MLKMRGRVGLAWAHARPLLEHRAVQGRVRAPASRAPVLHFHRVAGGRLFSHFMEAFERTWEHATPVA